MEVRAKVGKKGIIVIPKAIREEAGLKEGDVIIVKVEGKKIVIEKIELWDKVWKCCKGSAEDAEKELDEEEEEFWGRK
jgi:AbrB family looped-hinge helix DNA binding protein